MAQQPASILLEALQALYHHPEQAVKDAASKWLEDFQQTVEAWAVSDQVLHDPSSTLEAQYFCAQTLRTKIQRDFEELPQGAAQNLRSSLVVLLGQYRAGPPAVRAQLALALTALAGHLPASDWAAEDGSGGASVVQWIARQLNAQPSAVPGLLEMLAELPRESASYKIAIRPARRRQFSEELVASVPDALRLLGAFLSAQGGDQAVVNKLLSAFAAWLRLASGVSAQDLANQPLTKAALDGLNEQTTFDAAVDAVCELIRYTVSGSGLGDIVAHMPLVQVLVPRVMALRPRFDAALRQAIAEKAENEGSEAVPVDSEDNGGEDEDTTKAMARLFAELGEAYVELVASGSQEAVIMAQAMLEVAAHPDDNIASTTFNFWHKLSCALISKSRGDAPSGSAGSAAVSTEKDRRLALFRPLFQMLVSLVTGRVRYPPGSDAWRKDQKADFKHTRYSVADVLLDVGEVLGGEALLGLLAQPLFQAAQNFPATNDWQTFEASLYCIRGISRLVPPTESAVLPQVMALLPSVPQQHPQLLYTSALTIAAYSEWLASARNVSVLLPPVLTLLATALTGPEEAPSAAAVAFQHVCDTCSAHIASTSGHVDALLGVYERTLNPETRPNEPAIRLENEHVMHVIEGVCKVVNKLPAERGEQLLQSLCAPILNPLQQLVVSMQQGGAQPSAGQFVQHLDRLSEVFRCYRSPRPLADAFGRMWPLVQTLFALKGSDTRIMERLCRACKLALRTCGTDLAPMLPAIANEVQLRYQGFHQSCLLYVASEVVKVFGMHQSQKDSVSFLLNSLFPETLSALKSISDFTAHPDLADDCFLLAGRCLRYCPQLIGSSPLLPQLLDCALTGITVQHREACRSILSFLQQVLELVKSREGADVRSHVEAAIQPRGPTLLRILIAAITGALPEARLDELIDTLSYFAPLIGQSIVQWTQQTLGLIPSSALSDNEKDAFLQAVAHVASSSNDHREQLTTAVDELSDVCRRNKKVLSVVQDALQPLQLNYPSG